MDLNDMENWSHSVTNINISYFALISMNLTGKTIDKAFP